MKSDEDYRNILDSISDGVYRLNADGYFTFVNKVITERSGISPDKFFTTHFLEIVNPAYHDKTMENFRRVMSGEAGIPYELSYKGADGRTITVEVNSRPIYEEGKVVGLLGISRDITERIRAEEDLRISEERLRLITDNITEMIRITDMKGEITYYSPSHTTVLGYVAMDRLGKSVYELIHPEDRENVEKCVTEGLAGGKPRSCEYRIRHKDGHYVWLETYGNYVYKHGQIAGLIFSSRDITTRKHAEEELKKTRDNLECLVDERTTNLVEINTALKILLEQREKDKDALEEHVMSNIKNLIIPHIEKLKKSSSKTESLTYINILESNLKEITSTFTQRLYSKHINFTAKEIYVANLINAGKTSKEIAEIMQVSQRTVDFHRKNIRRKIGLKEKKSNLRTHLSKLT